jgi:hypothetical protein
MLDIVDAAEFVGVLIDETLDVTSTEQMVVYYRLVGPTGKREVVFAGIEPLPKGDAETIVCGLLGRLSRDGVPLTKLMSFGSDGASVLTGHLTGVGARLARMCPFLLAIHCILHREALAAKASAQAVPYAHLTFFPYIEQLGRFFRDSGPRTAVFVKAQEARPKSSKAHTLCFYALAFS